MQNPIVHTQEDCILVDGLGGGVGPRRRLNTRRGEGGKGVGW